jgi:hypothetical protein
MSTDVLALLVAGIAVVLAAAWIGVPLWRGDRPAEPPDAVVVGLLAEREAVLASLADLDAELAAGRLDVDEHRLQRESLVARGSRVLEALDRRQTTRAGEHGEK